MNIKSLFLLFLLNSVTALAVPFKPCNQDPERQKFRSEELQKIVSEDQSDRLTDSLHIDWEKVQARDEARRKRVGEIFGEGCFSAAQDYAAAALVYQHGNITDHYFQTFIWAKKAVELGDINSKKLMADGIDRYLMFLGFKQLFATQARKDDGSPCWCLYPVESSFPSEKRMEYIGKTVEQKLAWIDSINAENPDTQSCKQAQFCKGEAKDSPTGTVPGFW